MPKLKKHHGILRMILHDERGVSVIIGALLLTLLVVTAFTSFAVFISQKQESIQEQERLNLMRKQEKIEILSVEPVVNSTSSDRWRELNFTIANLHIRRSTITSININDHPVKEYKVRRFSRSTGVYITENYSYNDTLYLESMEHINLIINLTEGFFTENTILTTDYIKIELFTGLLNSFSKVFIPPSAIIKINTEYLWNASKSDYDNFIILDGTGSYQPGDGYIVSWNWSIEPDGVNLTGCKVRADFKNTGYHWVNLTVENNFGMIGRDSLYYYH